MTSTNNFVTVSTIAAVTRELPPMGEECIFMVSGRRCCAWLVGASTLRHGRRDMHSNECMPHWSELASIQVRVFGEAADEKLSGDRVRQFELLDKTTELPFAAGLVIGYESNAVSGVSPGLTIWLTGLSGAGKSTIAQQLERTLRGHRRVECLDADVVRTHLCKGLGFTVEDRTENVRRLALTARAIAETGSMVLVSAISPYRAAREEARAQAGGFLEVYVNAPLSVCESRDVKGLYKRARMGEIKSFTGIDDPYEPPLAPEIECRTNVETIEESVAKILAAVARMGEYLPAQGHPDHRGRSASVSS